MLPLITPEGSLTSYVVTRVSASSIEAEAFSIFGF